jgi:GTP cyclohydrolase I
LRPRALVDVAFTYFIERAAPVWGAQRFMEYESEFHGESNGKGDHMVGGVQASVTVLCPCSETIRDYCARNQHGYILSQVRSDTDDKQHPTLISLEELVKLNNERPVTMQAYDNWVFVEDMARNTVARLKQDRQVQGFRAHARNHKGIHDHGAFAKIECRPEGGAGR